MKSLLIALSLLLVAGSVGCEQKPSTAPVPPNTLPQTQPEKPLVVEAPGVEVKVGPREGVQVKAPGVEVDTK